MLYLTCWFYARQGDWVCDATPRDLCKRVVELTGPASLTRKALSSSADCFMADFEDATSPLFATMLEGQAALKAAAEGALPGQRDVRLFVRPRGLHLDEAHVHVDNEAISGALFDFGLFAYHGAKSLVARGKTPAFYLPKLESYLEARWWNDVFVFTQSFLGIPEGTFKATVLIETIHGAFQMDEILYELRRHSAGLNCGRWDYIFSYIRTHLDDARFVTPDRAAIGMDAPFMNAYVQKLVATCHRRGTFAMGGMSAQIPNKSDAEADARARDKVRADKEQEARRGHDGCWVAHPALIEVARGAFKGALRGRDNQLDEPIDASQFIDDRESLLTPPLGDVTDAGVAENVDVFLEYTTRWLEGAGAVAINFKMEDLATAEISRAQLVQWVRHGVRSREEIISRITAWNRPDLPSRSAHIARYLLAEAVNKAHVSFNAFLPDSAYIYLVKRANPRL